MTKEYGKPKKSKKRSSKKLMSRQKALEKLWRLGELSWKLKGKQIDLYYHYKHSNDDITTCLISRRFGKTYTLCCIALEVCIKTPKAVVKYVCPTSKMVVNVMYPTVRDIIEDCPEDIKPTWYPSEKKWKFPNGSEIQVAGTEGQSYNSIRGGYSHLAIVDEAAFSSELETVVFNVLAPTTDTTDGKIYLASTPNDKDPNHDFHEFFVFPNIASGRLLKMTFEDSPMINDKQRQKIIARYPGGIKNIKFRCEYLCFDENTRVKTTGGFKLIKNIEEGDIVTTHLGNEKVVKNVWKNKYDGRTMYRMHSSGIPIEVTEGHEVYVQYVDEDPKWVKVEDINTSRLVYSPIKINRKLVRSNISEDLAFIAGWYVAEGHHNKTQQQVIFSLAKKDPIDDLRKAVMNEYEKNLVEYKNEDKAVQLGLNSKLAKDFLKQFGRISHQKRVIDEIKYGSRDIKMKFLKAYIDGDGHLIEKGGRIRVGCNSTSYQLIQDISEMLASLGIGSTIKRLHKPGKHTIEGRVVNVRESWRLYMCGGDAQKFLGRKVTKSTRNVKIKDHTILSRITKIEKINYNKEFVYDLEVEDDNSYSLGQVMVHNCEIPDVTQNTVIPEFTNNEDAVVKEVDSPDYCDFYTGLDVGFNDLTAALFSYWDYKHSRLVILDEYIINGIEMTTDKLVTEMRHKEELLYVDNMGIRQDPVLRIMDNDLKMVNDLSRYHQMQFLPTEKHNKEGAVDTVRRWIEAGKIVIHPRCKHLIYHTKYAQWHVTKQGTWTNKFKHLKDSSDGKVKGGHVDTLDVLIYLVRNIMETKNPYPSNYGVDQSSNVFRSNNVEKQNSRIQSIMDTIMGRKKS